ncbi:two-component system response regulator YesN [Paenibacillus cellulosilyticus]|uniref:Two-component system response regulator YesN n=1 Tax=Paenibacillus cellulosilyticus TaxID=375489 RepID=A0A2V2YS26_9BACL|nr:response regulator [Paenibacillus cellulosilyticus]PWW00903.1 two-component system response regulator YesN [Paenibacillus cellulosilyticus]QKS47559.1 response regulator [Paenibacillus cellulosilyticus]
MKKVMLVDDEILIRENIRDCIPWEQEGFAYCGDAPDGEVALPLIDQHVPDILITDIKMPFMNGLELSRIVRDKYPEMKIIILSGHDEFEYAREALRLGVEDYCLKPVSAADIIKLLHEVSCKIDRQRQERERLEKLANRLAAQRDGSGGSAGGAERTVSAGVAMDGGTGVAGTAAAVVAPSHVHMDRQRFISFLKVGVPAEADSFIREYLSPLHRIDWSAASYGRYVLNDLTVECWQAARELLRSPELTTEENQRFTQALAEVRSSEDAVRYLLLVAEQFWTWRSQAAGRYSDQLREIKSFIDAHIGNDKLSLQDAAAHVRMSPSHLSKVFAQETGETFIEYVMQMRIRKAMELLLSTNDKTYEVAFKVGYNDAHYFSGVFRKATGMTPRDFRKRGVTGREQHVER